MSISELCVEELFSDDSSEVTSITEMLLLSLSDGIGWGSSISCVFCVGAGVDVGLGVVIWYNGLMKASLMGGR